MDSAEVLTQDQLADIVLDFKRLALEVENGLRLSEPPLSDEERHLLIARRADDMTEARGEAGRGDFTRAELAASVMIARHRLQLDEFENRQLRQALLVAGIDVMRTSRSRLNGNFDDPFLGAASNGHLAPKSSERQAEAPSTKQTAPTPALATGTTEEGPLFSTIAAEFLEARRRDKVWDEQTLAQAKKTCTLFVDITADKAIGAYSRQDANTMKATLQSLPSDYGKAAVFRAKPVAEILTLDTARKPSVDRLAVGTVKRHVQVLSALFSWVQREGRDVANPFQGLSFPSTKRANQQRDMWNTEDLRALFTSPVWTGCRSADRRAEPGTMIIRDERFWLPLIAVYSGLRQEEICQLQVEDVRKVDGYWCFDINARPPRKLKNKNAIRRVPLHPELHALGLLEYVNTRRAGADVVLFPGLSPGGADGRLGHGFSKWFARYRQAVGLYRKGLDFHSLRHTATTLLQRAGVSLVAIDELTGHATPGETARYSHGLSTKQLAEAVTAIDVGLDLSHLYEAR